MATLFPLFQAYYSVISFLMGKMMEKKNKPRYNMTMSNSEIYIIVFITVTLYYNS